MGISKNNEVELRELNQGLIIAIKEGYRKLIAEGDFLIIIRTLGKLLHGSSISDISSCWCIEEDWKDLSPPNQSRSSHPLSCKTYSKQIS
jgi:hypothetical protein